MPRGLAGLLWLLTSGFAPGGGGGAAAAEAPPTSPRYILCPNTRQPTASIGDATLRVYAASVASNEGPSRERLGRPRAPVSLRAALLFDDAGAWQTRLPSLDDRNANDGHAGSVSYAKCLGATIPPGTELGCRVGGGGGSQRLPLRTMNETDFDHFGVGFIAPFRNRELEQDFAHCALGAQTLRWRRAPGPPPRLHLQLAFRFLSGEVAVLPLEMCRVDEPLHLLSFCSQPLYGLPRLQRAMPWFMADWLEYHLDYLGLGRGDIYDVDGSFAEVLGREALERWTRGGRLQYYPRFAGNLSGSFEAFSSQHPYCAETWAYAHCLTTHRALSRHVLLLHAPDEYLVAPRRPEERGALKVLLDYQRGLLLDETVALMRVAASSFARGPGGPADAAAAAERGAVIASSPLRGELRYPHTPLVDPFSCTCAGPHVCYSEAYAEFPGLTVEVESDDLVVHHYVEMLQENVGRCAQQHRRCDVPDTSAGRIAAWLRSRRGSG